MDAKELTKVVDRQRGEITDLQREVSFLKQTVEKLQLRFDDMTIDLKMLERARK